MSKPDDKIESQSLEIGKWGNLVMAVAGIVASLLSRADALMIDGLYSGLNFVSAILAAQISAAVILPADRRYPFGYAAFESLYVTFRSLVLLGIMAFAIFGALGKIGRYIAGGSVPELSFGPILIYSVVMVAICLALAAWHRYNWKRSGKQSAILETESRAAVIDAIISGGVGGGFLVAMFLGGTVLEPVVPVSDSIIVLILCVVIARQPITMFFGALRQVAGASAAPQVVDQVRTRLHDSLKQRPFELLEVAVMKIGRVHFVVSYVKPDQAIEGKAADNLWKELDTTIRDELGPVRTELIIAEQPPYPA